MAIDASMCCCGGRAGWCRLYRETGLQLRSKSPKRRVKAQLREARSATGCGQSGLGDGCCPRPTVRRKQDPRSDYRRHLSRLSPAIDVRQSYPAAMSSRRSSGYIRENGCPTTIRLDKWSGILQPGTRFMGLYARRHARLQPARQADRQRIPRPCTEPVTNPPETA
jgi:hypothetical protein